MNGRRFPWTALAAGLLALGCGPAGAEPAAPEAEDDTRVIFDVPGIGEIVATRINDQGGRVSWSTSGSDRIAFDAASARFQVGPGLFDQRTDLYVMEADGGDVACITCGLAPLESLHQDILADRRAQGDTRPGFFIGQPEWHPDGVHLIFQVENRNSPHRAYNFPSFGLDNDLWLVNVQTGAVRRILEQTAPGNAFLHPRFSPSGNRLIFAARNNNGNYGNHWDAWYLAVADFNVGAANPISNVRFIRPNGRGLYETTGFVADSEETFSYSFTAWENGTVLPFVDDGFITDVGGSFTTPVVQFPNRWDEKPRYSPSGENLVVMSNRFDPTWSPAQGVSTLTTELFLGPPGGTLVQITNFRTLPRYAGLRLLITDHEWNAAGNALVVQVQPAGGRGDEDAEIWRLDLPRRF